MTCTNASDRNQRIPCTDGFDRVRSVGLWTAPARGRIVLVAPPAETALLTPDQARALRDRLDALARELDALHKLAARHHPDPIAV